MILRFYKRLISPILVTLFGHACRFEPTCSEYFSEAVHKYGILRGSLKGIKRISRCNPFSAPRWDPVK